MISFDDDLADFRHENPSEDIFGPPSSSSSKLASLFEDESVVAKLQAPSTTQQPVPPSRPSTLFSAVVHIFVPAPETAEYASFGRGGVALISRADTKTLLLYTAAKTVLTQLPIVASTEPHTFPLSLAHPYVYFTAVDDKKWSIVFDDDDQLKRILAWYLLISRSPTTVFDLSTGVATAPVIEEGDAILIGVTVFSVYGDELKIAEESDVKLRLSSKRQKHEWEKHLIGLRKGAIRMICSSPTVTLYTIKKVRQRESDSEPRTAEISTDTPRDTVADPVPEPSADPTPEHEESIEAEPTVLPAENTVLQRMARLGKPMLGLAELSTVLPSAIDPSPDVSSPPEEKETTPSSPPSLSIDQSTVSQDPVQVAQPRTIDVPPTVSQPAYADFHRVVGLEMDRLQIRLEASFSRMLQESLGPISDRLSRLEERQEEIIHKLQTSSNDS